jgi:transketolase
LSKVLGLVGNISRRNPTVAESLQLAANAKLDNLILISEPDVTGNSANMSISELHAIGFFVEEIGEDDVQTIYEKLMRARLNSQRQPQVIIVHGPSGGNAEISPAAFSNAITPEDFFIPDTVHNHFALLNMRRNSDYENWQYRFECAVDFHPEILQFVEGLRAH